MTNKDETGDRVALMKSYPGVTVSELSMQGNERIWSRTLRNDLTSGVVRRGRNGSAAYGLMIFSPLTSVTYRKTLWASPSSALSVKDYITTHATGFQACIFGSLRHPISFNLSNQLANPPSRPSYHHPPWRPSPSSPPWSASAQQCKFTMPSFSSHSLLLSDILIFDWHSVSATPQGPIKLAHCTFTATPCAPPNGPTETITVYEQPFTVTSTKEYNCHGCTAVAVKSKNCDGFGVVCPSFPFCLLLLEFSVFLVNTGLGW